METCLCWISVRWYQPNWKMLSALSNPFRSPWRPVYVGYLFGGTNQIGRCSLLCRIHSGLHGDLFMLDICSVVPTKLEDALCFVESIQVSMEICLCWISVRWYQPNWKMLSALSNPFRSPW